MDRGVANYDMKMVPRTKRIASESSSYSSIDGTEACRKGLSNLVKLVRRKIVGCNHDKIILRSTVREAWMGRKWEGSGAVLHVGITRMAFVPLIFKKNFQINTCACIQEV